MRLLIILISILTFNFANSQSLLPKAQKLKIAFDKLLTNDKSLEFQKNFLDAFPSDSKSFLSIFQSKNFDQLDSDYEKYLLTFEKCSNNFPNETIDKSVDIGKSLIWDADAVGLIQNISIKLANKYLRIFISKFRLLTDKEQNGLIAFFADVENFDSYPEYQELINNLKMIDEKNMAQKFEKARQMRKLKNDH